MNISYPFIRRPVGTTLLAIGLFLAGDGLLDFLPVASVPAVDFRRSAIFRQQSGGPIRKRWPRPFSSPARTAAWLRFRVSPKSPRGVPGSDRDHHPVRFEPQGRQRRARCAGRAEFRPRRSAARPSAIAHVSQIQPGLSPVMILALTSKTCRRVRFTMPPTPWSRSASCRSPASPMLPLPARSSRLYGCSSIRSRSRIWACPTMTCGWRFHRPTCRPRSARSTGPSASRPSQPTINCARPRNTAR